jgi:hypothetical protein
MTSPPRTAQRPWVQRVGWLILIWMVSVIALAVVAALLRTLMNFAGLSG